MFEALPGNSPFFSEFWLALLPAAPSSSARISARDAFTAAPWRNWLWRAWGKSGSVITPAAQGPAVAPPRTGTTQIQVRFPPALLAAVDASIAGQSPRLSRPEEIRRLVKERLAGEPAPAPAAPSEDTAELRRQLSRIAGKIDGLLAYTRQLEEQRDALAAWRPKLEVVSRPGEQFGARPSPRAVPPVERWPADPRSDPQLVARARAQLAAAEEAARRREELRSE